MKEDFDKIINSLPYQIQKMELTLEMPNTRQIDNIFIYFDEENFDIIIFYKNYNNSHFRAVDIFNTIVSDPAWWDNDIITVIFNNQLIFDNSTLNDEAYENIFQSLLNSNVKEDNFIKIKVKKNLFYYEKGCILYKSFANKWDDYFIKKQLDAWKKNK